MLDWLSTHNLAPFILMTVGGKAPAVNPTRIVEAVIIAAITALATTYGTVQVVTVKLERMEKDVQKLGAMAEEAVRVQQQLVPMRNLQVSNIQQSIAELQERVKVLERANRASGK